MEFSERIEIIDKNLRSCWEESKSKKLRDKHSRAEDYVDNKLKERDSLMRMKSEMKRSKIENVVENANEILERKKSMALESFESKMSKAN